jgi:hypothetical protein
MQSTSLTVVPMLFRIKSSFGAAMAAYSAHLDGIIKRFGRSADFRPEIQQKVFVM